MSLSLSLSLFPHSEYPFPFRTGIPILLPYSFQLFPDGTPPSSCYRPPSSSCRLSCCRHSVVLLVRGLVVVPPCCRHIISNLSLQPLFNLHCFCCSFSFAVSSCLFRRSVSRAASSFSAITCLCCSFHLVTSCCLRRRSVSCTAFAC